MERLLGRLKSGISKVPTYLSGILKHENTHEPNQQESEKGPGVVNNTAAKSPEESASITPAAAERRVFEVKIVNPLQSGATVNFIVALQSKLEAYNIQLINITLIEFNDDTGEDNVLLVCNNHSRLASDVTNTLKDVKRSRLRRVFLVIVHCKNRHNLPQVTAKEKLQKCENCEDISNIVDIAFMNRNGDCSLYDCDMNSYAINLICQVFKDDEQFESKPEVKAIENE